MLGLTILLALSVAIIVHQNAGPTDPNWKEGLVQMNADLEKQAGPESNLPEQIKKTIRAEITLNQYNIDHDIAPMQTNVWKFLNQLISIYSLVSIFVVIIAGDIVSSEFSWGTIKLLLIRPASRAKVLYAKYITVLITALTFAALLFVAGYVIGGLFFGFNGADQPHLYMSPDAEIQSVSIMSHDFLAHGLEFVSLMLFATMAFMISAAFRSSIMSIAFSLLFMLIGTELLKMLGTYDWAKYVLMANTKLISHIEGPVMYEGTTMAFSVTMLAIYFVVFHAIAWFSFTKRDVAG